MYIQGSRFALLEKASLMQLKIFQLCVLSVKLTNFPEVGFSTELQTAVICFM